MSDLPTSAMGVLRMFSVTKTGIDMFSRQLVNAVKNGEVNALELKAFLKSLEAIIERVDKETRDEQLKESDRYPEKTFYAFGCQVEKAEVGVRYDYLNCGDPVYEQRHVIFESAKRQLDERAEFLKSLREQITIVDEGSGEVVCVRPPLKKGATGLKFSIK
jgi:hypothetical protein